MIEETVYRAEENHWKPHTLWGVNGQLSPEASKVLSSSTSYVSPWCHAVLVSILSFCLLTSFNRHIFPYAYPSLHLSAILLVSPFLYPNSLLVKSSPHCKEHHKYCYVTCCLSWVCLVSPSLISVSRAACRVTPWLPLTATEEAEWKHHVPVNMLEGKPLPTGISLFILWYKKACSKSKEVQPWSYSSAGSSSW